MITSEEYATGVRARGEHVDICDGRDERRVALQDEVIAAILARRALMLGAPSMPVCRSLVREISLLISQAILESGDAQQREHLIGAIWGACAGLPWPYHGVLRVLAGLQPDALVAESPSASGDASRSLPELAGAAAVLRVAAVELARDTLSYTPTASARRFALAVTSHSVANWITPRAWRLPIPLDEAGLCAELADFDSVWGLRHVASDLVTTYMCWKTKQVSALERRMMSLQAAPKLCRGPR